MCGVCVCVCVSCSAVGGLVPMCLATRIIQTKSKMFLYVTVLSSLHTGNYSLIILRNRLVGTDSLHGTGSWSTYGLLIINGFRMNISRTEDGLHYINCCRVISVAQTSLTRQVWFQNLKTSQAL